jgi:imidazoleglycerol-phosphate dehydratase
MDETLARAAVDVSGRSFLVFEGQLSGTPLVSAPGRFGGAGASAGGVLPGAVSFFQIDTVEDFWRGFAANAGVTQHLEILRGRSDHHKVEALFKAAARSLREACEIDPRHPDRIPSTKGMLA